MSEPLESMMFRPHDESRNLLILLSGRLAGFRQPLQFGMAFATRKVDVNRLYLRDNFGMWYHDGLEGITSSFMGTADFLREHIAEENYQRVSIVGVSSGGYAALVLGAILDVDEVHAFGPPTLISENMRDEDGSNVKEHLKKLFSRTDLDHDLLDVRRAFKRFGRKSGSKTYIHYDPEYPIDTARAAHVADLSEIEFVECPGAGHQILQKYLKDRQFFERIANGTAES